MRAISLASGSSGNALVVEHDGFAMLVDCGLAPRRLATLLREAGIAPTDLGAVLFTHEHSDHVCGVNVVPRPKKGAESALSRLYREARRLNPLSYLGGSEDLPNMFDLVMNSMNP